ncbi:hypothetical protein QE152_g28389 [Popillia japonica]|uniref:Integrase zinc-binding domain-containing protein n=1 Tax=Popillia japonica TaxID=7064 RepID=A0AAW1JIX3_POPJA
MATADNNVLSRSEKVNNSLINEEESDNKRVYDKKVLEYNASHANTEQNVKKPWSLELISKTADEEYLIFKKKCVDDPTIETADEEYLIFKKKCVDDPTIRIIPMEKYFEILKEVHKTVGHGGRLKMIQHIKNRLYRNILKY